MDFIERIKEWIGLKNKPTMRTVDPPKFQKGKVIKDDDISFHMRYAKSKGNLGCNSVKTNKIQVFLPLFAKVWRSPRKIRRNIIKCVVHEFIHREISHAIDRKSTKPKSYQDIDHAFFEERLVRELCGQETIGVLQFVQSSIRLRPMPKDNTDNEQ